MMAATRRKRALAAVAGAGAIAAIAAAGWAGYRAVLLQPVERVVFAGDVERLRPSDLEALARAIRDAGPVSLETMREAAKRVPWVRDASVRRAFPDTAEITVEAHRPFARWNDGQVVSVRGEVFTAEGADSLPWLRGPEGAGAEMVSGYTMLSNVLVPLGAPIKELRLSARGSWQAVLASGLRIELGRGEIEPRARRLVAAWPKVSSHLQEARYVDLRYPNGFASAMKNPPLPNPLPKGRGSTK